VNQDMIHKRNEFQLAATGADGFCVISTFTQNLVDIRSDSQTYVVLLSISI
jgi:hypothetical protein